MLKIIINKAKRFFPESISRDQAKDTGMAMVLLCLLIALLGRDQRFIGFSVILLLINMIWPLFYKPLAFFWFGLANLLGAVVSRILFSLIFIIMVVPVGFLRKLAGKDSLKKKLWKKGSASVMTVRNHQFVSADILHPF